MNESRPKSIAGNASCESHVANMDESCLVMNESHPTSMTGNALCARQVPDMNKSCPTSTAIAGNRACVNPRVLSRI